LRGLETALIPLGPAEGEIGTHLGQPNAPDQLARRVENQPPGMTQWSIRAAPQITEDVGAHVVRPAFDAVYRHVGEQTLVGDLCALQVEGKDDGLAARPGVARALAGTDQIEGLVIGRETETVRVRNVLLGSHNARGFGSSGPLKPIAFSARSTVTSGGSRSN